MVTWRQRLRDLLCVKSIVTILLTVVFVALTLAGRVSSQEFLTIFFRGHCVLFWFSK